MFLRRWSRDGRVQKATITGPSYGNDLTATWGHALRIRRTFVERTTFGSDDGFDTTVLITLPADYPGHRLERGFQGEFECHNQLVFNINNFVSRLALDPCARSSCHKSLNKLINFKFNYRWYKRWWYVLSNTFT